MNHKMNLTIRPIILLVVFICSISPVLVAQQTATTQDGKLVILSKDGTWKYLGASSDQVSELQNLTVYITKTGEKYHVDNCRYLSKSKYPITLGDAVGTYGPCSVCDPPRLGVNRVKRDAQEKKEQKILTVYVTRTGSKYHRAGCRYLKKSSTPISLGQARKLYGACSVCKPPR